MGHFGDREAFDIIATTGKQPDHTGQNAGFIVHKNR